MSDKNKKINKIIDFFATPEKIIDYSKEHWSILNYSLIVMVAGLLLGVNFFWSNFRIDVFSGLLPFIPLLLVIGWLVLAMFMLIYLVIIWGITRVLLVIKSKRGVRKNNPESETKGVNVITKENIWSRIRVISYCYLIPFLILQIFLFCSTLFLYSIDMVYVLGLIKDFGTIFIYVWIVPLTLYSIKDLDKAQQYKMNVVILASWLLAYLIHYIFVFEAVSWVAVVIQNLI
jgi:hypothetical protein